MPISTALPKVTVAVRVEIEQLLDLTNPDIAAELPIAMSELIALDWRALMSRNLESASQTLGWAAYATGFQGLKVPSRPDPNGVNIVVFPENLMKTCRLEVMNADELDKLGRSM